MGRFLILALCVVSAYSLPAPKSTTNEASVIDLINKIEGIINIHSADVDPEPYSSLTPTQIENIVEVLNKIEGIVNIHSIQTRGGVINIPGFIDAVGSILGQLKTRSSLTPTQVENILDALNKIEGIINIHSADVDPEPYSSLTPTQIENIVEVLNKIEGIVNIHSIQTRGGVINIPGFIDAVGSILGQLKTRSSLTPTQVENILDALNKIEGIINIHSADVDPEPYSSLTPTQIENIVEVLNKIEGIVNIHSIQTRGGVINIPGFIDAVGSILGQLKTRSSLTPTQVENILDALNKIEGIINIHSANVDPEPYSSLTPTQIENIVEVLNKIEGIVNIHSIQTRGGVINIPGFIDAVGSILGQLKTRSSLTPTQVENILDALNKIEGIINIHSANVDPEPYSSLTPTQIENIVEVLNKIEGIVNIHSIQTRGGVINIPGFIDAVGSILGQLKTRSSLTPNQVENILDALNKIEGIINIHSANVDPEPYSSLTPTQIENIVEVLNKIEGIVNIHSIQTRGGVINIPGFIDAVGSILGQLKTRSSLTPTQVENILDALNKIEGIINIHSANVDPEPYSSLTPTQIENIVEVLNKIEGIVNIHFIQTRSGVINIPGFIDAVGSILGQLKTRGGVINIPGFIDAIDSILGQLSTRSSLTSTQVDNIVDILNQIEGIVNIH